MTGIGYALSSEERGPSDLGEHPRRAEAAGSELAPMSDHFHPGVFLPWVFLPRVFLLWVFLLWVFLPWADRQGRRPFVRSVIGAIAAAAGVMPGRFSGGPAVLQALELLPRR